MAKKRHGKKRKQTAAVTITALLTTLAVAFSLLVTAGEKLGWAWMPTWSEISAKAGLHEEAAQTAYPFHVYYIDVGQGDAALIHSEDGSILIDAGENADGNSAKIVSYAKQLGITAFDYVIATHPHSDHIGAMAQVLAEIPAKRVIMPRLDAAHTPATRTYEALLAAIDTCGADVLPAEPGKRYQLGKITLDVLSPFEMDDNLNNVSAVVKATYGDCRFLFMGDAESELEQQMLAHKGNVQADVLKLGHHGSKTSSTKKFLQAVNPQIAVISCGKSNSYGHPNAETLKKLADLSIDTYRTDFHGSITVGSDGNVLEILTQRETT